MIRGKKKASDIRKKKGEKNPSKYLLSRPEMRERG